MYAIENTANTPVTILAAGDVTIDVTINITASVSCQFAASADKPIYMDGEKIEMVRVATTLTGGSVTYITASVAKSGNNLKFHNRCPEQVVSPSLR